MKKFIIIFIIGCLTCACNNNKHSENYTVIVSLDAFRWDYPEIHGTPWLDSIANTGVLSVMKPSFPASTFPNHYTIATGLVPDHHGLVNSNFWDPVTEKEYGMVDRPTRDDPQYYGGEPIWITAEKQGVRTANIYWVGSDIPIKGTLPSIYNNWYDVPRFTYAERVDEALRIMSLSEEQRPRLLMVYFDDPDMTGHEFGPKAPETGAMVNYLDSLMGVLYSGLKALPHGDKINLIVTSDHGMTDISDERFYDIDDYIKPEWCEHIESSTPTSIFTAPGYQDSVINALAGLEHIRVYKKADVPAELNYGTSSRLGDIIVIPDLGWQFAHTSRGLLGAHGYNPDEPDMQVIFRACGPDFKQGFVNPDKFVNVDIYSMLSYLLGIKPEETDGQFERVKCLLK